MRVFYNTYQLLSFKALHARFVMLTILGSDVIARGRSHLIPSHRLPKPFQRDHAVFNPPVTSRQSLLCLLLCGKPMRENFTEDRYSWLRSRNRGCIRKFARHAVSCHTTEGWPWRADEPEAHFGLNTMVKNGTHPEAITSTSTSTNNRAEQPTYPPLRHHKVCASDRNKVPKSSV
jgi:hypothetical protein